jgi:hypothetical protein
VIDRTIKSEFLSPLISSLSAAVAVKLLTPGAPCGGRTCNLEIKSLSSNEWCGVESINKIKQENIPTDWPDMSGADEWN